MQVQTLEIPEIVDERGSLCFLEGLKHIPFEVKRVFWTTKVPKGKDRGGHAHQTNAEVVFAISGSVKIKTDDGKEQLEFVLDKPNVGLVIPPNVWADLTDFKEDTVLVVMASEEYSKIGYIHNYQEFKQMYGRD